MSGTAIITGAAGFIGSRLVRRLLGEDWTVIGVDSFDDFYDPELKRGNVAPFEADPRFSLFEIDIRDAARLRAELDAKVTGDIDVLVHTAALAGVRPSSERPVEYYEVNIGGTAAVCKLMPVRSIPHLVFLSSSSVYGINPDVPWTEDAVPQPISVYATSKLVGESLVGQAADDYGFSAVSTRLFSVYGPGQRPDLAITNFASRMINGMPIPVFGDGSALRDFTYVDDIVAGLRAAMDFAERRFEVFNFARGRRIRLCRVVEALEELLDIEAKVDFQDSVRGDVPQTWGSIEKSRCQLGYWPQTDLETGLEASRRWFHRVADMT